MVHVDFDKLPSFNHTRNSPVKTHRLTCLFHGDIMLDIKEKDLAAEYQNDYRKKQERNGMVRYEIQVPRKLKDTIEEIASEVAEEYATPRSIRQRMCKARAEVLEKATQNIRHEFFELKDRIRELKQQIEALSPSFFKTHEKENTPIPDAILSLPDNPKQLKQLLATTYIGMQTAKTKLVRVESDSKRYLALYDLETKECERLREICEDNGIEFERK